MEHETRYDLVDVPPVEEGRGVSGVSEAEIDMGSYLGHLALRTLQDRLVGIYPDQGSRSCRLADEREQGSRAAPNISN
jgi:hypothetical protein